MNLPELTLLDVIDLELFGGVPLPEDEWSGTTEDLERDLYYPPGVFVLYFPSSAAVLMRRLAVSHPHRVARVPAIENCRVRWNIKRGGIK